MYQIIFSMQNVSLSIVFANSVIYYDTCIICAVDTKSSVVQLLGLTYMAACMHIINKYSTFNPTTLASTTYHTLSNSYMHKK